MRRAILMAALLAAIVGCANEGQLPDDQQNEQGGIGDTLGAAISSSDWTIETLKSGIDGEVHTVSRVYEFSGRQTQFQVAASCVAGTGVSELTIDSLIGDP